MAQYRVGADRDLRIVERDSWDGDAARASMFGDGEEIDQETARRGHLVYDAEAPELKGSYKLPFAMVIDGELVAVDAGLRAAASRLPQTDIPDDVKDRARSVLDAYFERMNSSSSDAETEKVSVEDVAVVVEPTVKLDLDGSEPVELVIIKNGKRTIFGKGMLRSVKSSPGKLVVEYSVID